ncbi:variant erythrocyte surface antigen-1 family protein [Babesia caballi]|uniref:Variant erythrocyte surface antigen-1 family protein n=1 Tax=Babesia caballi TaxID=5871 RepID=A0AAV4LS13_BABCB|nr:variant erythrocyte surface antigen-1 family protein [Babesia caballi]
MGEQKSSLTDWPEDLKDVIDWFLRLGGKDTGSHNNDKSVALKNAVEKLKGYASFKSAFGNGNFEGLFGSVTKGLQQLIGYDKNGQQPLDGKGIALKGGYTSSYGSAKWEDKLDQPDSEEAHKVAKIFIGYMPLLHLCLIYLYWRCSIGQHYGGWGSFRLNGGGSDPLSLFMSAMGFKPSSELQNKSGYEIANLLTNDPLYGFEELKKAQQKQYSYPDFLGKVSEYGESTMSQPVNCPLYVLYNASMAYLKSRYTDTEEPDRTIEDIKNKIQTFHKSFRSDDDLKDEIDHFISTCLTKPNKSGNPSPSPAAPVAGALTTLGIGGGAAAAYLLNLGGAKTLVTGLLKIG